MATKTKLSKLAPKKAAKKAEPAAQAAAVAPRSSAPTPAQTIKVAKPEEKYKGARAAWYGALKEHDGKSSDAFVAACNAKPPTMPKSGRPEDPRGWLRFFVREGVAKLA